VKVLSCNAVHCLVFHGLVGENVKVSKGKATKDKAQSYCEKYVNQCFFHGVALKNPGQRQPVQLMCHLSTINSIGVFPRVCIE
jgi:hypothetical protein